MIRFNPLIVAHLGMACVAATAAERPNIILIMVDDKGCDWVSCYAQSTKHPMSTGLPRRASRYTTAWCTRSARQRGHVTDRSYPFRHGWLQYYVPRGGFGLD